jgi:hypothetical protein
MVHALGSVERCARRLPPGLAALQKHEPYVW